MVLLLFVCCTIRYEPEYQLVTMTFPKIGTFCGVLAPILWAVSIVACGTMRPRYNYILSTSASSVSGVVPLRSSCGTAPHTTGLMYVVFATSLLVMFESPGLARSLPR